MTIDPSTGREYWRDLVTIPKENRVRDCLDRVWEWDRAHLTWIDGKHMSGWHCPQAGLHKPWGAGQLTYLGPFTKIEGEKVPSRSSLTSQIAELEAQLAIAKQELADSKPSLPKGEGEVIKFRKFDYEWAAIKIRRNGVLLWFVTQDGTRSARQGIKPMADDEFLTWVYESNWDSIEAMY